MDKHDVWDDLEHIGSYTGTTNDGVKEAVARGRALEILTLNLLVKIKELEDERDYGASGST